MPKKDTRPSVIYEVNEDEYLKSQKRNTLLGFPSLAIANAEKVDLTKIDKPDKLLPKHASENQSQTN